MNRLTTLLGGVFVILISVVFVVNFQPGGGRNQMQDSPECAAEVLGDCVRREHYQAAFHIIVPSGIQSDAIKQYKLRQLVMDGLVERELLCAEAKRLGIGVSEEDLTAELKAGRIHISMPSSAAPLLGYQLHIGEDGVRDYSQLFNDPKTQKFSSAAYTRTVTELTRMSEVEFRDFQRKELIAQRMREVIKNRIRISESEARDQFTREKSTATVKYAFVTPAFIAEKVLDRSDAAIAAWADKNADQVDKAFESRKKTLGDECRVAHHILLRTKPDATDEEKKKVKDDLLALKKKIDDGASFEEIAKAHSGDIETSKEGGALGCVSKGDWPEAFDKALFGMEKDGAISDVVETPFGVHLIRLDKVLKGDDMIKAARIRAARKMYVLAEAKRLAVEGAQEIQKAAKGGKSLDDAVAEYLAKVAPQSGDKKDADKKDGDTDKKDGDADKKDADADKKDADADTKDADNKDDGDDEPEASVTQPPTVETSLPFSSSSGPFTGAAQGEDPTTVALGLAKPGDVADKLIMMQDSGAAIMQLVERKAPADDGWEAQRDFYFSSLRQKKQAAGFADYMRRLRAAHAADIHPNDHFTTDPDDKPKGSSSSTPTEEE